MIKFKLNVLLAIRNMNQSDLSRKTGIRYGTINAYYNNYEELINKHHLDKICKVLGCTLSELIEYIPDKE